jgi:predicted MFS family arabinose efflux permease
VTLQRGPAGGRACKDSPLAQPLAGRRLDQACSNKHPPVASRRLRTFGILFPLWLMVFTAASQTIIVTPILPIIGDALDIPEAEAERGLLVSVYAWVLAVAALVMGPISDRIGRRQVMLLGSGALVVVLALHGLVQSLAGMLVVRALAGAAGGMLSGAAVSYVGDYFDYERRGWATGWVMSGVSFGLVLGIPLGRVLAAAAGFRLPFLVFSVIMAVAFVLILVAVPQPDVERERSPVTLRGSLVRYRALLAEGPVRAASATYFLMYLSLGLLVVYLPQWLTASFPLAMAVGGRPLELAGAPIDFIAVLFLIGGMAGVVVGPASGTLSDRIGRKPLILVSCAGLAVVTLSVTFVVTERWVAFPIYILIMALFAMRMSPFQALLTALVPDRQRGTLLALAIAMGQLGTGLGASLSGTLYGAFGYRAATLASAVAVVLLAVVVWVYLPEPETGQARATRLAAAGEGAAAP